MKMRRLATAFLAGLFFASPLFQAPLPTLAETAMAAPDAASMIDDEVITLEEPPPRLQLDYEYDNELVTSLYHLYGSVLDDFVNVFLTNNSDEAATLLVETRIEGYTNTAFDTVNIPPHQKVEVKQNPRLLPDSIDKLNARHPGNFVIKVTELLNGEDDPIDIYTVRRK